MKTVHSEVRYVYTEENVLIYIYIYCFKTVFMGVLLRSRKETKNDRTLRTTSNTYIMLCVSISSWDSLPTMICLRTLEKEKNKSLKGLLA